MTKLIVFLGNPGSGYERTRHNIAWMLLEHLPFFKELTWTKKFKGQFSSYVHKGESFVMLKPETYMNLSGESAVAAKTFFKILNDDVLVVHDELDISYGQIQFKSGGGVAGHNGLKSLMQHLGDANFKRLRVGISRPEKQSVSSYVLSAFSDSEKMELEKYLTGAVLALVTYIEEGFEKASNKFSKKKFID